MIVTSNEKRCTQCHKIYPASSKYFHIKRANKDGLRKKCKECRNKIQREYYHSDTRQAFLQQEDTKIKFRENRKRFGKTEKGRKIDTKSRLKIKFGLTLEDYNSMFNEQNGCCGICGRHQSEVKRALGVDHDHETNKIRGLLCGACNRHLGRFEKGRRYRKEIAEKMIDYLRKAINGTRTSKTRS